MADYIGVLTRRLAKWEKMLAGATDDEKSTVNKSSKGDH